MQTIFSMILKTLYVQIRLLLVGNPDLTLWANIQYHYHSGGHYKIYQNIFSLIYNKFDSLIWSVFHLRQKRLNRKYTFTLMFISITLVSIQIGRKPVPGLNILVLRCLKKHTGFFLHSYFSQLDLIEISP